MSVVYTASRHLAAATIVAVLAILLLPSSAAFSHPGGTDENGCHAGSQPYHCHGGGSGNGGGGTSLFDQEAARQRTVDARQKDLDNSQARLSDKIEELESAERDRDEQLEQVAATEREIRGLRNEAAAKRRELIASVEAANARLDAARMSHIRGLDIWQRHRQMSAWIVGTLMGILPFLLLRSLLGTLVRGRIGFVGLGVTAILVSIAGGSIPTLWLSLLTLTVGGLLTATWISLALAKWAARFVSKWSIALVGGLAVVAALTFIGALLGIGAPPEEPTCQPTASHAVDQPPEAESESGSALEPATIYEAPCNDQKIVAEAAGDPNGSRLPDAVSLEERANVLDKELPELREKSEPLEKRVEEVTAERDALEAEVAKDQSALDKAEDQ